MSLRTALQAAIRLAIAAAVVLSGVTFSADDAEARRGGKVRTAKERTTSHDDAATKHKSDDADAKGADDSSSVYVPRVRSREASRGPSDTTTDAGKPSSQRAGTSGPTPEPTSSHDKDIDVPGCAAGMICTVCLAGCEGSINSIIDAQPMTPRPKRRE
jgi:hypothetical protein